MKLTHYSHYILQYDRVLVLSSNAAMGHSSCPSSSPLVHPTQWEAINFLEFDLDLFAVIQAYSLENWK